MTSLYIHTPWCASKCPYCDFASIAAPIQRDEATWLQALLYDLDQELESPRTPDTQRTPIETLFMGGGTPSLLTDSTLAALLAGIEKRLGFANGAEITLEANPGTFTSASAANWHAMGFNRVSIGVQSFDHALLRWLGRIHDAAQAKTAIEHCIRAGFARINLDLISGIPGQTHAQAVADIDTALSYQVGHISCYQLIIEDDTPLAARKCTLPDEHWQLQFSAQMGERMATQGYQNYEVSAWSLPRQECRHNLIYWRYMDYLGIGSAAHGKLSLADGRAVRTVKEPLLERYLQAYKQGKALGCDEWLSSEARIMEFMLNQLRLREGFSPAAFTSATNCAWSVIAPAIASAIADGLLYQAPSGRFCASELGWSLLDTLIERLVLV